MAMDQQGSGERPGFNAYVEAPIGVIGHAEPPRDSCLELTMPVARKSVEPLAGAPTWGSAKHHPLLHFAGPSALVR